MREEKEIIIHEGGTSNLLVHRTKTMIKLIIFALSFCRKTSFQTAMFESEKSRSYVAIHDQFYLKCSGVWNDHYYVRARGGKDELQIQHSRYVQHHCRSCT